MTEFWTEYGLFAAKAATLVLAVGLVVGRIVAVAARGRGTTGERITIRKLNEKFRKLALAMQREMLPPPAFKQAVKAAKAESKAHATADRRKVYVLDFQGDLKASAVASLREEVTAVLAVARPQDEVVVRLESAGGMVHAYGLAASQLQRLRERGVRLVVTVDKIAASGGYMMACVADRVLAAPFAVVGSIGVVAQVPNFHRLLKRNDIDFELVTAGEFKRTLTVFGENTDKSRAKFQQDLDDTHSLFKDFVRSQRPALDLDKTGTGEHWYGRRAVDLGLVDEVRTSDDYLLQASRDADLFEVHFTPKRPLGTRLAAFAAVTVERVAAVVWQKAAEARYF